MIAEASMRDWLDDAWSRTEVVQIVTGGEDGGPLDGREVLAGLRSVESIDAVRALTTRGWFTGDICRCHGGPTVVLLDSCGRATTSASIHGFGSVSWDRPRFRNDLNVLDPAGLHIFLARQGVPRQLALFLAPLTDLLDLHEGRLQFRPAGKAGQRYLADRRIGDAGIGGAGFTGRRHLMSALAKRLRFLNHADYEKAVRARLRNTPELLDRLRSLVGELPE